MTKTRRISSDYLHDDGMTLIEVMAAIIVIIIVALASAGLTINGIQTAASQERTQVAVTIANGQLETVSGWSVATNSSTTVSNLFTGRFASTVTTAFAANSTKPGVSTMYPGVDPTATGTSVAAIPITTTSTQNGTLYTITTLIGYCYEPVTGGSCNTITGVATLPATVPNGYTQAIRSVVLVSWTAGSRCATTACFYQATTLTDPHIDLQWVTH